MDNIRFVQLGDIDYRTGNYRVRIRIIKTLHLECELHRHILVRMFDSEFLQFGKIASVFIVIEHRIGLRIRLAAIFVAQADQILAGKVSGLLFLNPLAHASPTPFPKHHVH